MPTLALLLMLFALAIELLVGEPPAWLHPVVWMGRAIGWMDRRIPRGSKRSEMVGGLLMTVLMLTLFVGLTVVALGIIRSLVSILLWLIISAYLTKCTFALLSLRVHALSVRRAIKEGDIESARAAASMLVSRDVSSLDIEHVVSATVESVSENAVDSVFSPLFFLGLGGLPAAMGLRTVNTMDAMLGYRNERHRWVGLIPARLDDLLHFVPARISLPFLALASLLLGEDWRACIKVSVRDHGVPPSPNSGWSMAAVAGALGISMDKPGCYMIGDGGLTDDPEAILRALRVVEVASLLFLAMVCLPLMIYLGLSIQLRMEDAVVGLLGALF